MKITLLGTGTPVASLDRQSSGYLFEVGGDDDRVSTTAPAPITGSSRAGTGPIDVTHAFFSHLHYDHCMDYARLVLQRWDQGADRIPDLQVFGPTPIARMTEQLFGEDGVYGPDIRARIEHQSSIDVFQARGGTPPRRRPAPRVRGGPRRRHRARHRLDDDRRSRVARAAVSRMSRVPSRCRRWVGLLFRRQRPLRGDHRARTRLRRAHPDEPPFLGHRAVGRAIARPAATTATTPSSREEAGVKTLVLTHLLAQIDRPGVREQIVHEIRQEFDGTVIWGEDLMTFTITPSGVGKSNRGREVVDI